MKMIAFIKSRFEVEKRDAILQALVASVLRNIASTALDVQ